MCEAINLPISSKYFLDMPLLLLLLLLLLLPSLTWLHMLLLLLLADMDGPPLLRVMAANI